MDLALNNLQSLICHKTQQTKPIISQKCMQTEYYTDISYNSYSVGQK